LRNDGRNNDEMRVVKITPNYLKYPHGSALVEFGDTKVICTAMIEEKTPSFLRGTNQGWVTAEYEMIPGATQVRTPRDAAKGKISGRSQEIQRLIGRSLRSVTDMAALGERTIWLDCDVIQADGGTRTASITGAFVALVLALNQVKNDLQLERIPLNAYVAAVSVGIVENIPLLDLCYEEDSRAMVDMNFVMTSSGEIIEIQGTGEERPFLKSELLTLMDLAEKGIKTINQAQKEAIGHLLEF